MEPTEFLKTVYLGDRACKRLLINGWNGRVELQVDVISRVRDQSGHWNFYTDADITDGLIVFSNVSSIKLSPSGPVPNDYINSFVVHLLDKSNDADGCKQLYVFQLSVSSVDPQGNSCEVCIDIIAEDVQALIIVSATGTQTLKGYSAQNHHSFFEIDIVMGSFPPAKKN